MMTAMDIRSQVEFDAGVAEVFAMLIDQGYLEELCQATGARAYEASVQGMTTKTSRKLPAPPAAAKFTGPELTVVEEMSWAAADGRGNRVARQQLSIPGQPVKMQGTIMLTAGGRGTIAELRGVLTVSIPFVGKKLEQAAAPAVLAGFRSHQKAGDAWLARQ